MKQLGKDLLVSGVIGFLLPGMILNYGAKVQQQTRLEMVNQETEVQHSVPVNVRHAQGNVLEWEMDDYLVGAVLAEMPASFEPEALKAQSVVARTYARKASVSGGKHGDGSICTNPSCCQGYQDVQTYLEQGGREEDIEKIRNAVLSTSGQVLTYEGELIEATYFSCSGGSTEDALAVWGTDFPYLQAVDSPGEEHAASYLTETVFSKGELEEMLGIPEISVSAVTYTEGGGVDTIAIGGKYFTGLELREKLDLHSTAFSLSVQEDQVIITTKGYGHRVGMSQYGADAMAVAGSSCAEILQHYYQGTELTRITDDP